MMRYPLASLVGLLVLPAVVLGADAASSKDKASSKRKYPPAPPVVRDIDAAPLYEPGTHGSVIDPVSSRKRADLIRPLKEFMETATRMSHWYSRDNDAQAAECGIKWLRAWADGDAVLGELKNFEATVIHVDFLTEVSEAWLALKPASSAADQKAINSWLHKVAARAQKIERGIDPKKRNNIYYWNGLAILQVGVATGDKDFIAEARKIYKFALTEIQDDGTLPLEMAREGRALIYHAKSAGLLSRMAELARTLGEDWSSFDKNRLKLLVDRVEAGKKDPSFFAARAHAKQEMPGDH